MSQYTELVANSADGEENHIVSFDPRAVYVSCNFIVTALSTSLFVFLLMERFSSSSFLVLVSKLDTFNVLTAIVLFFIVLFSSVSVVAVWIRNRRLLSLASGLCVLFVAALVLAIVWTTYLQQGLFESDLETGFMLHNNQTMCPSIGDAKCCGWATACDGQFCPRAKETCSQFVHENVRDYAERVLPIAGIVVLFHILSLLLAWNSKKWKMSTVPVSAAD